MNIRDHFGTIGVTEEREKNKPEKFRVGPKDVRSDPEGVLEHREINNMFY